MFRKCSCISVDRHNLAYVYAPSKINKKIHATAINFVIMSVALLQFLMVVFSFIRSGDIQQGLVSPHTKVCSSYFILLLFPDALIFFS